MRHRAVKYLVPSHTARMCTWVGLAQKQLLCLCPEVQRAKDHGPAGPVRRLPGRGWGGVGGGGFDLNPPLTYSSFLLVLDLGFEVES